MNKVKKIDFKNDAYGREVLDYLNGEPSYEIVEREDGFIAPSAGPKFYFQGYDGWPNTQKESLKFVKGKILDIGAGAGRISLYLQKTGYDVTAIDNSPLSIEVCKKRGIRNAIILPIEGIEKLKKIDTILMLGNNFGLFGNYQKARKLLKIMHKITNPGAIIIAESNDPYNTKEKLHLQYHNTNIKKKRMPGQTKIRVRYKNIIGNWFDYLLVSEKEMIEIIQDTGWKIKQFIKSGGSDYIAIIEKL